MHKSDMNIMYIIASYEFMYSNMMMRLLYSMFEEVMWSLRVLMSIRIGTYSFASFYLSFCPVQSCFGFYSHFQLDNISIKSVQDTEPSLASPSKGTFDVQCFVVVERDVHEFWRAPLAGNQSKRNVVSSTWI